MKPKNDEDTIEVPLDYTWRFLYGLFAQTTYIHVSIEEEPRGSKARKLKSDANSVYTLITHVVSWLEETGRLGEPAQPTKSATRNTYIECGLRDKTIVEYD